MAITEGTILKLVASLVFPDDVIMQNVFHLVLTTVVGDNDAEDIVIDCEEYLDEIWDEFQSYVAQTVLGDQVKVYEYDSVDDDFDEVGTGVLTFTGGAVADLMPHGTALLTLHATQDPDVQGKKYFGGFTEANHADGDWAGGLVTGMATAVGLISDVFTATVTSNVYTPVVWSPTKTNAYNLTGVDTVKTLVAYQRRRKPGVGI